MDNLESSRSASGAPDVAVDFSALKLRQFISPGLGVVFNAPNSWEDVGDEELFQVIDPETDTQFTASGYKNPGISLQQWTDARLSAAAKGMPFLEPVKVPYEIKGVAWAGIAAKYRGVFPESDHESHYLVLCLRTDQVVISFTITAKAEAFAANEALYLWLIQNQLDVYQVKKIQDDAQGVTEMRQLAERGNADAQFSLAVLYEVGQGGAQDHQQAAAWYRKAAERGHIHAQFNLGVYYANGQGVLQDYEQAIAWWRKAADQGNADAQYYLALMYGNGLGVAQDRAQALAWCRKAAEQGHEDAQAKLAELA